MQIALLYVCGGERKRKKERTKETQAIFAWKNSFIAIKTRVKMDNFFTYTWAHTSTASF